MNFKNYLTIVKFTISDELHNKSFYVMAGIGVLLVFMLRGCFNGNVQVNGQSVNALDIGYWASIVAFNLIAVAGMMISVLLSMRLLKRDREYGMASAILSKPVRRTEYMAGKITGIWLLGYGFTLLLHICVYILMLIKTGGRIPFFIPASLITSIGILFATVLVMFLSTVLPDVIAALVTIGSGAISIAIDSFAMISDKANIHLDTSMSVGHILAMIWPKVAALLFFATSLIREQPFLTKIPIHPVVNLLGLTVAAGLLLFWKFSKEEIA
jgi:ABC-type transport system involved in multi-copper enzyme maturation permease subunit